MIRVQRGAANLQADEGGPMDGDEGIRKSGTCKTHAILIELLVAKGLDVPESLPVFADSSDVSTID